MGREVRLISQRSRIQDGRDTLRRRVQNQDLAVAAEDKSLVRLQRLIDNCTTVTIRQKGQGDDSRLRVRIEDGNGLDEPLDARRRCGNQNHRGCTRVDTVVRSGAECRRHLEPHERKAHGNGQHRHRVAPCRDATIPDCKDCLIHVYIPKNENPDETLIVLGRSPPPIELIPSLIVKNDAGSACENEAEGEIPLTIQVPAAEKIAATADALTADAVDVPVAVATDPDPDDAPTADAVDVPAADPTEAEEDRLTPLTVAVPDADATPAEAEIPTPATVAVPAVLATEAAAEFPAPLTVDVPEAVPTADLIVLVSIPA